jgi:peptidoglycan-associated lipoprotein
MQGRVLDPEIDNGGADMNRRTVFPVLLVTAGLALSVACSAKPKAAAAPEMMAAAVSPPPVAVPAPAATVDVVPPVPAPLNVSAEELNREGHVKDAFFDFDRYDIRPDQRDALTKDAEWLRQNPRVRIVIEGHCDERGTSEYNMALGQQRAEAAKEYLVQLGVAPTRIQIVSYGRERPFATGHDERAWARNRRDHLLVTGS